MIALELTRRDLAFVLLLQDAVLTLVIALLLVLTTAPSDRIPTAHSYRGGAIELHPDVGYADMGGTILVR
jgi:hypothetical protein